MGRHNPPRRIVAPGRRWIGVAVACALAAFSEGVRAQSIVGLGTLPGRTSSYAIDVSADGSVVVGGSDIGGARTAFRWSEATGMQDLGVLPGEATSVASGVSSDGSVVAGTSGPRAFRWVAGSGMTSLGTIPGWSSTQTLGMSGNGSVIVGIGLAPGGTQAWRWTSALGIRGMGTFPGALFSFASAASEDGLVVVGESGGGPVDYHAFRWTPSGGMRDLGAVDILDFSAAYGVNRTGSVVVGQSGLCASRWTFSTGMLCLDFPKGWIIARALGVSGDGSRIVGWFSGPSQDDHAFLWTAELGSVDLNEHLPTLGIDLEGWVLLGATAISTDGRTIVGTGRYNGAVEAFVVTLGPPCLADFNHDGLVDHGDFGEFTDAFLT